MRLVADENIEKEIVDRLRTEGRDFVFIAEAAPGIDDLAVLDRSIEAGRLWFDCGQRLRRVGL